MKIVKLLFFLTFCIGSYSVNAQSFGLKGGLLFNDIKQKKNIEVDNSIFLSEDPDWSYGYLLGAMYRTKTKRSVSFQTELTYQQKGGKYPQIAGKAKFQYLDLSILGLIKILDKTTIDFGVGNSFSNKEFVEKHDVGLIGGFSQFLGEKVQVSLRYYHGLKPLSTLNLLGDTGESIGSLKLFNRNVQLTVGYYFL